MSTRRAIFTLVIGFCLAIAASAAAGVVLGGLILDRIEGNAIAKALAE